MIKNMISVVMGYKRMKIAELSRLTGLQYNTASHLYHDKTKGIDFDTLNKLCYALDCTPNDLFKYIPD